MKFSIVKISVIFFIIGFSSCEKSNNSQNENEVSYPQDLKILHKNVIDYHMNLPIDSLQIEQLLVDLQKEGSWATIDYEDKIRGKWPVKIHLDYVQTLAIAYHKKDSKYYKDDNLSEKIQLSLNYWLTNDFLSTNWHDQHIGVPERLLPIMFLMENELSKKQWDQAMILLHRAKIKMTGQNKVWLSTNVMLRSLLLRKSDSVAIASKAIQDELKISKGVGIKSDWSYHEHAAQLQFGNYGLSYLEDMIKCYMLVRNTPFQFENDKIELLRNYILKGQQWVIWNGKYDISASGRQLFPDEQTQKYKRLKDCIEIMKTLDQEYAKAYNDAVDSKALSGNKHFWRSDFHVHRTKDFYFSVRMSSKRVIGTESVNRENIQGYYMGDGVALLYQNEDDYKNILPFWNWKKLPGVSAIQNTEPLPVIKAWDFKTNGHFVGGVSDGENGIAVMDYDRDGLKAKKSWFMFGDYILSLGSGINANTNFPVVSSINQVFLKGPLEISKNDVIEGEKEQNQSVEPDWILHNNTGYLFPEGGSVKMETRFLEGTWNTIAKRYRPVILTEHILRLWFDHGSNPKNESYAYILVPNASKEQMQDLHVSQPFDFKNNTEQQSVISKDGNLGGIVFYNSGTSYLLGGITVNKPCVILFEQSQNGLDISVSDPAQNLTDIQITISGSFVGQYSNIQDGKTVLNMPFPEGEDAGKTTKISLKKR